MKKSILLISIIFLSLNAGFSKPLFQTSASFDYSYDTNVFSSPLPTFDTGRTEWLNWRSENPFIKSHSIGTSINLDYYHNSTDRVGLSSMLNVHIPLSSTKITPIAETEEGFIGKWHYQEEDNSKDQNISIFGSLGPVFKASFNHIDMGFAIRLSMGTYNTAIHDFILGMQAEPFMNIILSKSIYITAKFTYDAHFLRFIKSKTEIYDNYYMMVSLTPSIGVGVRF